MCRVSGVAFLYRIRHTFDDKTNSIVEHEHECIAYVHKKVEVTFILSIYVVHFDILHTVDAGCNTVMLIELI